MLRYRWPGLDIDVGCFEGRGALRNTRAGRQTDIISPCTTFSYQTCPTVAVNALIIHASQLKNRLKQIECSTGTFSLVARWFLPKK